MPPFTVKKFKFNTGVLETNHLWKSEASNTHLEKAQHRIDAAIQESAYEHIEEENEELNRREADDVDKEDIDLDQFAADELEEDPEGRL